MSSSTTTKWNINARDKYGWTALFHATDRGDCREVRRLLKMGAHIGYRHESALHIAATKGHFEIVQLLLDYTKPDDINAPKNASISLTPLHLAAGNYHVDVVEFLCFKGADVNKLCDEKTCPMRAALFDDCAEAIEVLVAFGADETPRFRNYTLLMDAVYLSKPKMARLLLDLNFDCKTTDSADGSWNWLRIWSEPIRKFLRDHLAKSEKERQELRLETLNRIRSQLSIRLMRCAQPEIVGICLALASLESPPYVLLWIIDWLPNYDRLSHHKKISLIESVRNSIWKIKDERAKNAKTAAAPAKKRPSKSKKINEFQR